MKEVLFLNPEYEIGQQVTFIGDNNKIVKAIVKNVTQSFSTKSKIFYYVEIEDTKENKVIEENDLLFTELSFVKPLFDIGMKVGYITDVENTMVSSIIKGLDINITTERSKGELFYNTEIFYTLENKEILTEDDIVAVSRQL